MLRLFYSPIVATVIGLIVAFYYYGIAGVSVAAILAILEISLSFDNAIINAAILKDMETKWRQRFLTWGILVAVFGMRLVFPIGLVSCVTDLNPIEVLDLAIKKPDQYAMYLDSANASISAFGGMFLLMVFLGFILNHKRDIHWLGVLERKIGQIGNLESIEVIAALLILVTFQSMAPHYLQHTILIAGIAGLATYVVIHSLTEFMNNYYRSTFHGKAIKHAGIMSFVYIEILDASFSFDGVMGAFAISKDIFIIMIGLAIGAYFVRSLTLLLVHRKTLDNYIYLEHGAHYAMGALAVMMLVNIVYHIQDIYIGGIGFVIIILSYFSSVWHNKKLRVII
jgi:hypothetical protein